MQSSTPHYSVTAYLALPDFEAESTFVRLERQYVARQLARPIRGWAAVGRFIDRAPTHDDWLHYDHDLQQYARKLEAHSDEIAAGLVPIRVAVQNETTRSDRSIRVHITVKHGEIHQTKKPPKRPQRIDQLEPSNWMNILGLGRFWRSDIKITAHNIEAKFSRLRAQDGAYVVNEPLYIQADEAVTLMYRIHSHNLKQAQTGLVD